MAIFAADRAFAVHAMPGAPEALNDPLRKHEAMGPTGFAQWLEAHREEVLARRPASPPAETTPAGGMMGTWPPPIETRPEKQESEGGR